MDMTFVQRQIMDASWSKGRGQDLLGVEADGQLRLDGERLLYCQNIDFYDFRLSYISNHKVEMPVKLTTLGQFNLTTFAGTK